MKKISFCIGFVAGLLVLVYWFLFQIKQAQVLLVSTGSMQPALSVGSLILVIPQPSYQTGEVISYRNYWVQAEIGSQTKKQIKQSVVTHRIVKTLSKDKTDKFQTKGDSNDEPDADLVKPEQILGKVMLVLPLWGWLSLLLQQKFIMAGLLILLLFSLCQQIINLLSQAYEIT